MSRAMALPSPERCAEAVIGIQIIVFGWPDGGVKSGERGVSACAVRLVLVQNTCVENGEVDGVEGRIMGLVVPLWSWECKGLSHQMYNDKPVSKAERASV